jgi:hypothetical protein
MFQRFRFKPMWSDGDAWTDDEIEAMHRGVCFGGGGKGGKPQPMQATQQNVTQTNIPEYARPYFEDLMARTQQESINTYQPYSGQRLADQSADTAQAYQNIRGIDPTAGLQQARDYLAQAGQAGQTALGYGGEAAGAARGMLDSSGRIAGAADDVSQMAGNVGSFGQRVASGYQEIAAPRQWGADVMDQYMSPYQQGVTDIAKREAIRDDNISRLQRNTAAQRAGAFGGSRQGVVEGMAGRDLGNRLSDLQTTGLQSAYTNAQQQFGQDRSATMAAQIENARNALQGGNMMTSAGNLYGTAGQLQGTAGQTQGQAGQLFNQAGSMATGVGQLNAEQGRLTGALSAQEQQQQMQHAQALQQIGAGQEARQQAGLDMGYTDFLNQRDYPRQNLNFYSGILRGMNVQPQSDTTTYQPAPNPMNQMLGLGMSAAGAYMGMR